MNGFLALLALVIFTCIVIFVPEHGAGAVLVCVFLTLAAGALIRNHKEAGTFLLRLFISALLVRVVIGTIIFVFRLQDFFGGDAVTYDNFGYLLLNSWLGEASSQLVLVLKIYTAGGGWGMLYMVAAVYALVGRNPLSIQLVNAVLGAATAPLVYMCAQEIFQNSKVSRISAIYTAFFPSLVLWSSQGLKDGPIVFLLAFIMLAALKLGQRFTLKYLAILLFALFAVLSLRFYIFYMVLVAIGGSFFVGMRRLTTQNAMRQFITIIVLGLGLTYLGVLRVADAQLERYATLEVVQNSRQDQARTGGSGFGKDVDVSTTSGALGVIPTGLLYLLFAPFPWQLATLRQSITLPEMLVWWTSFPLFILGLWFTIRYRLRQALPVLIFTSMLTLAYSIFQGNVGTAYRQRAQLLIFYFIFVAVGIVLFKERREDKARAEQARRQQQQQHPAPQIKVRPPLPSAPYAWRNERAEKGES
jgi:hypothetical protein